ncbi:MAG TPA: histidine phosphatase family protein, partial [Methylophilaceae bacterium]|nr:histidine phosphatase family protein [Methylophilaceae bacterium]
MELYLIRHTTPEIAKGVCYGQSDIDLAASFDDELALLRAKLPLAPAVIYSSPSQRCLKLATAIAGDWPIQQDPRLMELHFGEWELRQWDDIPREQLD